MEGCCLDRFRKTVKICNFYDSGGGDVHQYNDKVWEFIYIYMIQICKMQLRLQLVSVHYWLGYLRKKMIRGGKMWGQTDG